MNPEEKRLFAIGKLLISRLERLSADSIWARRVSGLRGSLLRGHSLFKEKPAGSNFEKLEILVSEGFKMLEKAAKEIPDIEVNLKEFK